MTEPTASKELLTERHGPVLVARLNRPEARNALTTSLVIAIAEAVTTAEADPDVRAVVLTGTGDRAFCAGMDLRSFAESTGMTPELAAAMADFSRLMRGEVSIPLVGAANATAVAGGFELLLACDVIVASREAVFGLPEVKRGLFAAGNGTGLATRVPMSIALELALTGDTVSAARAYELGLVNAVVEPDQVLATALGYAERIAANAPLSLAATKELVRLAATDPQRAVARVEHWRPVVFGSEDAKEGAMAFVQKRPPVWRGR